MKTLFVCIGVLCLSITGLFGQGSQAIIKQRAKDLSNQNNARQGVAPPAAPAATAPVAPTPAMASPPSVQQQNIARLKADLAALHRDHQASDQASENFRRDLLNLARGSGRPSVPTLTRLSTNLAAAMAGKSVTTAADDKLVSHLVVLFNSVGLSPTRVQELAAEVKVALQNAGVPADAAAAIATDLEAVAAEVQHSAHV